jgi:hypothetical protein
MTTAPANNLEIARGARQLWLSVLIQGLRDARTDADDRQWLRTHDAYTVAALAGIDGDAWAVIIETTEKMPILTRRLKAEGRLRAHVTFRGRLSTVCADMSAIRCSKDTILRPANYNRPPPWWRRPVMAVMFIAGVLFIASLLRTAWGLVQSLL